MKEFLAFVAAALVTFGAIALRKAEHAKQMEVAERKAEEAAKKAHQALVASDILKAPRRDAARAAKGTSSDSQIGYRAEPDGSVNRVQTVGQQLDEYEAAWGFRR